MNGYNFTDRVRKVLKYAREEAIALHHAYIGTEHQLLGLVREGKGVGATALRNLNVDLQETRQRVLDSAKQGDESAAAVPDLPYTSRAKKVLELAMSEARDLNYMYVGTEHLVLGMVREGREIAAEVLTAQGVTLEGARTEVLKLTGSELAAAKPAGLASKKSTTPALDHFTRDLTQMASERELDDIIGRDKEITRLITVLCRHRRNSALIIGLPKVGKSALLAGLVQRIARGEVPLHLVERRVCQLDFSAITAGTKYRGQFEERVKVVMSELAQTGAVLALDEVDWLDPPEDMLAVVRALTPGVHQFIATGSPDVLTSDGPIARTLVAACMIVEVEAPSPDLLSRILNSCRRRLEDHHSIAIADQALDCAVRLAEHVMHVSGLELPLDLLEEAAAASATAGQTEQMREVNDLKKTLEGVRQEKEVAVRAQNFEEAAGLREKERELEAAVEDGHESVLRKLRESPHGTVGEAEVVSAFEGLTGVSPDDNQEVRLTEARLGMRYRLAGGRYPPRGTPGVVSKGTSDYEHHQVESILQGSRIDIERGTAFVLLPQTPEYEALFQEAIQPAMAQNGLRAVKANDIYEPGAILAQIWTQVRTAEVVVADMSGVNLNVIYELGLCHGLHRCPLLLVREPQELPFNVRSLRYIQYENSAAGVGALRSQLTSALQEFLTAARGDATSVLDD